MRRTFPSLKDFLNGLPDPGDLMGRHRQDGSVPEVNSHIHSPWSFCSFESIEQMFEMAQREGIAALGINDFFTVDGYGEFEENAFRSHIFPIFNIEFMGLIKGFQEQDVRVNDPNNPGRVYFSGKALRNPPGNSAEYRKFLENIQDNSRKQVTEMCKKTDALLREIRSPFGLQYNEVKNRFARNLVRERHIARAIREMATEHFPSPGERLDFFERLFGGLKVNTSLDDMAGMEEEIRSAILKKGGRAFIPEDSEAFPDLPGIIDYILDTGGIPCYPVLLDDGNGNIITPFEGDWDRMDGFMQSHRVSCLELIPRRNSLEKLQEFVNFFLQKKYVISFGTEHNSPGLFPVTVKGWKDRELPAGLKQISYRGISVFAAHQYLVARGGEGFVSPGGRADLENLEFYQDLGHAVIREFRQRSNTH